MVVSCRYDNINVQITKIDKIQTERTFNGRTIVYGTIEVKPDEEESFCEDFIYKGKSGEPKSKIIEYTRQIGIEAYKSRLKKQDQTLLDYVNSFSEDWLYN